MTPATLVVVPTYNERDNLPLLIEGLMQHGNVRVLVVDDQSPDGTGELADSLSPASGPDPVRTARRTAARTVARGRPEVAIREPVDLICQMDADLSHDPAQLPAAEGVSRGEVATGRAISLAAIVNWPSGVSCSAGSATRISARSPAPRHDCTSGYRCWRRDARSLCRSTGSF
jgi:dolichol-phosphate mannosyltransferase